MTTPQPDDPDHRTRRQRQRAWWSAVTTVWAAEELLTNLFAGAVGLLGHAFG